VKACDVQWRALVQFQEGSLRIYCMNLFPYCIILTAIFASYARTVKRDRNHMGSGSYGAYWSSTFPGVTVMKSPYGPNVKQEVLL